MYSGLGTLVLTKGLEKYHVRWHVQVTLTLTLSLLQFLMRFTFHCVGGAL